MTPTMRTATVVAMLWSLAAAAAAETVEYKVVESRSSVRIHVGKSGAFSFAGHTHEVAAPVAGTVRADPSNPAASSVDLRFASAALRVLPDAEPAGDAPKVQEVMQGDKVLDSARFPEIRFVSKAVQAQGSGTAYELKLTGDLTLHGVTRELAVPVRVALDGRTLTATGQTAIRHDTFGLKPVSAAGGTVKVANELRIEFTIVAERP
jgi:polyisoprenoid-binding protein YceI